MLKSKKYLYEGLLFIVAIIWGSGFIASKIALNMGATPILILTLRFLTAAIMLSIIFFKHLKTISKSDIIGGFIVGLFLFLGFIFQTFGILYTTPSKNAFLTGVNVIIVPFLCWILYCKKPPLKSFLSAIICFIGIGLLTLDTAIGVNLGDLLTLICAVFFALHIVFNGHYSNKINPIKLSIIQMYVAFILSLISFVFMDINTVKLDITLNAILAILYLGIFCTSIAFFIQTYAQKKVPANKAAIFLSTESVFGTVFSVILLKESLNIKLILGCIVIFIAILISEVEVKKKQC
ncbi:DMT family transporter [Vallitalea guaymasensis]|uniref:DMT family transporter n=1 Tax=Vallitalea guaymasensis TaxID=1185412 RepID=UPI000DE1C9A8|nr:DMT family transporter [Vallitalea guaymasensis]